MRTFILITVLGFGAFWTFDQYAFNGQHVRDAWQQAKIQSRSFSAQVQHVINDAMSGR